MTPSNMRRLLSSSLLLLPAGASLAGASRGRNATGSGSSNDNGLTWTSATRMNEIQVVGTHNSYHVEPQLGERAVFETFYSTPEDLYYSHPSLDAQLRHQSVRNFELDVYADPDGGHYADPLIRRLAFDDEDPDVPELEDAGVKVLHISDLDIHSVCTTLVSCLEEVKAWSDDHPDHVPIPFVIEFKESEVALVPVGGARPLRWADEDLLSGLDDEIRSVFPDDRLITPDDVRDSGISLEQSILDRGWPDLDSARGRVFFLMDNDADSDVHKAYKADRPNLEGRVLFTNSDPGNDDCAFRKLNDPEGSANRDRIRDAVQKGYWVRTRADVPVETLLRRDDGNVTAMRDHAFASGAHIVSTDFQAYGMSSRWDVDYAARLAGGKSARCNPVTAGDACDDDELEPDEYVRN